MTNNFENPYASPTPTTKSTVAKPLGGVFRYSDLPRSCPNCERKFSETLYRRLYPRRFRLSTIAFFVLLAIVGLALLLLFGWLALFVIVPLGSWATTWHKKVRVRCTSCGWAQTFIVSVRDGTSMTRTASRELAFDYAFDENAAEQKCPWCEETVIPKKDGRCPACDRPI